MHHIYLQGKVLGDDISSKKLCFAKIEIVVQDSSGKEVP